MHSLQRMRHAVFAVAALLLMISATAFAKLNSTDRQLMEKLGQGDSSEVDLAKLVKQHAEHPRVIDFAQKMIDDHGTSFKELDRIADSEKAPLKGGMDAEHKEFAAKLARTKHGLAYDRRYIDDMIKDHENDARDVRKALRKITDPELKRWTENELKTVEQHLKLAREVRAELK